MATPNVIQLQNDEKVPDGYIEIKLEVQPHAGRYAVKPQSWCKTCHGTGVMYVRVEGVRVERHCDCMARRLKLHLRPDAPANAGNGKSKPTQTGQPMDQNQRLRQEIERLEAFLESQADLIQSLESGRLEALKQPEQDLELVQKSLERDKGQRQAHLDGAARHEADAAKIQADADEQIRLIKEQTKALVNNRMGLAQRNKEQADDLAPQIAVQVDAAHALEVNIRHIQREWSAKLRKAGGGKIRRAQTRLATLQERLAKREQNGHNGSVDQGVEGSGTAAGEGDTGDTRAESSSGTLGQGQVDAAPSEVSQDG